MDNNHLNREEALHFIEKVEKERRAFRKSIRKEKETEECQIFDLWINRASFQDEAAIELIELGAEKKNIFQDYGKHIDFY